MIRRVIDTCERLIRIATRRADPMILMYHRVAETTVDPWGLAVSPRHFDEQMAVLARTRKPVPLDWLAAEIKAGRRPQGAVAVTFDDGYLDILENARPSLVRHGIPATVFIVSGMIGDPRGFWWDQLAELIFGAPEIREPLTLSFSAPVTGNGDRNALHLALWKVIRVLPLARRYEAVAEVARLIGTGVPPAPPIMTEQQLHALTDGGLITLGVHTVTHPSLPSLSAEDQEDEIARCKAEVERITGLPNPRLAYPFGDFDGRTLAVAERLGFDYAVSVMPGAATRWSRRFRLPRHDIKNWSGARFEKRLGWL